jgi:hypothetical protein
VVHDQENKMTFAVQVGLAMQVAQAILLFHKGGPWTVEDTKRWETLTGSCNVTTRELCNLARRVVGEL